MPSTHSSLLKRLAQATLVVLTYSGLLMAEPGNVYWAMMRDGAEVEGPLVGSLHDPEARAEIDGTSLFDARNPAMVVVHRGVPWADSGPLIELANGDLLAGTLVRAVRIPNRDEGRTCAIVAVRGVDSLRGNPTMTVRVPTDAIRRVTLGGRNERPAGAGELVFRDGRRAVSRSLHWAGNGLRALMDDGVRTIAWSDLAEYCFQDIGGLDWLMRDATHPGLDLEPLLVTLRLSNGGRYTYPRAMVRTRFEGDDLEYGTIAIQPAWALDAIRIPIRSIAACTYRRPDEIPASHLDVVQAVESTAVHEWAWRKDANVFGGPLTSGRVQCDLGVGMHAPASLTLSLPSGAKRFQSIVGLDNAAGDGGCVKYCVEGCEPQLAKRWESGFLQGSAGPVRVGPLDVEGIRRLRLSVDMAHEGRPAGADPMDLRDHANWLLPLLTVDLGSASSSMESLEDWIPELAGWRLSEEDRLRMGVRPHWDKKRGLWRMAMIAKETARIGETDPIALRRQVSVRLNNAFMHIAVGRDTTDSTHHRIQLRVNGEPVGTTMNGDVRTNAGPGDFHDRYLLLSQFVGQEVDLELLLSPEGKAGLPPAGIIWHELTLGPLIRNLPESLVPLRPTVPLSRLSPIEYKPASGKPGKIRAGQNTDGSPLVIRGYPFDSGFGLRAGSSISYALDPSYRRFVAVLGLSGGWQEVGAYTIFLDGQEFWTAVEPSKFGRNTPGLQIDLPLPAGHRQIELRVAGRESYAAWAAAGFMASP